MSCNWVDGLAHPPTCSGTPEVVTLGGHAEKAVRIKHGRAAVVDLCTVGNASISATLSDVPASLLGAVSGRCGASGYWAALFGPGDFSVRLTGRGEARIFDILRPVETEAARQLEVTTKTEFALMKIATYSSTPIMKIVGGISKSLLTYSNLQQGTFVTVRSNGTDSETLAATLAFSAPNATVMDPQTFGVPGIAGAFFPASVNLPTMYDEKRLPGIVDSRWSDDSAWLITLSRASGSTENNALDEAARIVVDLQESELFLGKRALFTTNMLGVQTTINTVVQGISNVMPIITLTFSSVTTLIIIYNFYITQNRNKREASAANMVIAPVESAEGSKQHETHVGARRGPVHIITR